MDESYLRTVIASILWFTRFLLRAIDERQIEINVCETESRQQTEIVISVLLSSTNVFELWSQFSKGISKLHLLVRCTIDVFSNEYYTRFIITVRDLTQRRTFIISI